MFIIIISVFKSVLFIPGSLPFLLPVPICVFLFFSEAASLIILFLYLALSSSSFFILALSSSSLYFCLSISPFLYFSLSLFSLSLIFLYSSSLLYCGFVSTSLLDIFPLLCLDFFISSCSSSSRFRLCSELFGSPSQPDGPGSSFVHRGDFHKFLPVEINAYENYIWSKKKKYNLQSYPNPNYIYNEYHAWYLLCISHCEHGRWHGPQHKWDHQRTLHISGRRIPLQGSITRSLKERIQHKIKYIYKYCAMVLMAGNLPLICLRHTARKPEFRTRQLTWDQLGKRIIKKLNNSGSLTIRFHLMIPNP